MVIVDINLLLYAINEDAPDHVKAKTWWESTLNADEPVGLAWLVILGFIRISTNPRILPAPLPFEQAARLVDEWLEQPPVRVVHPSDRHWSIFTRLLAPFGTAANLTSDAHLAALAIEHGARLYSADLDFGRFPHLQWDNPLA